MTKPAAKQTGPLDGIRVVDLTSVLMGPYCTQILADLGADVVKVESPLGDTSRYVGPTKTKGRSGMFANLNRGKRGVVLDLQMEEGRELCLKLVERADIVLHSMRKPAIERLRLNYETVSAVNPGVIYASLYGYGREGRYSGRAAYDDTIQAVSGMAMLQAEINPEPQYVTTVLGDKVSALSAAYALMAALFHRQRGGKGQEIEVPMFEIMASFLLAEHIAGAAYVPPLTRPVYTRTVTPYRRPYKTADGYISVLVYNDKQWQRFAALAGRPDLAKDERFISQSQRSVNIAAFCEFVAETIAQKTSAEWMELLNEAEIPVARLNEMADLYTDPHLADVGFFRTLQDPLDGAMLFPESPVRFSDTPGGFERAGPMLGEHTAEVLRELGISDAELEGYEQRGAIRRWSGKA